MRLAGEEKLLLQQSGSDLAGFAISQDGSADLAFGSVLLSGGIAIQGVECFHSWSNSHSVQVWKKEYPYYWYAFTEGVAKMSFMAASASVDTRKKASVWEKWGKERERSRWQRILEGNEW